VYQTLLQRGRSDLLLITQLATSGLRGSFTTCPLSLATVRSHCPSGFRGSFILPLQHIIWTVSDSGNPGNNSRVFSEWAATPLYQKKALRCVRSCNLMLLMPQPSSHIYWQIRTVSYSRNPKNNFRVLSDWAAPLLSEENTETGPLL
jgi:hypothetical protein